MTSTKKIFNCFSFLSFFLLAVETIETKKNTHGENSGFWGCSRNRKFLGTEQKTKKTPRCFLKFLSRCFFSPLFPVVFIFGVKINTSGSFFRRAGLHSREEKVGVLKKSTKTNTATAFFSSLAVSS